MNAAENTSRNTAPPLVARNCWVQGRRIYLEIDADRSMSFPASQYVGLETAPQVELEKIHLNTDGSQITWDSLDQTISVDEVAAPRFN